MYANMIDVPKYSNFTNIAFLSLVPLKYDQISVCVITNPFLIIFMFLLRLETQNPNQKKYFCHFVLWHK